MHKKLSEEQKQVLFEVSKPGKKFLKIMAIAGSGKAQPYSEIVLTPDGWKTMKEINKNDYVIGSDGKKKIVLNIYEQGTREVYKIKFIDGTQVLCDKEHLWTVYENNKLKTETVSELLKKNILTKKFDKRYNTFQNKYRYSIPLSNKVEYNSSENKLLLNPYCLGLLLGDGGMSGQKVKFTNSNLNIIEKLKNILPEDDKIEYDSKYDYIISSKKKWKKSSTKLALIKYNLDGKKSVEKHIPKEYLYADVESREQLLQGLIDTDGYLIDGRLAEYSTSSKQLAGDFLELARGLGHIATIHNRIPKYTYNNEKKEGQINYRIRFLSKTKKSITSIEYSHKELCKCIEIDSEDHLYVTNGFNLTHNTATLKAITDITKPKNALYLAYNKAIADESKEKFDKQTVTCSTTHSLAYHYIVKRIGYKVTTDLTGRSLVDIKMIYPKEIQEDRQRLEYYNNYLLYLEYSRKDLITAIILRFLTSKYIKFIDFVKEQYTDILEPEEVVIATSYINMMKDKHVPITHSFYLKMLHIFMHLGKIKLDKFDLVMLDEAGDINEVTLEIFNLIECDKKIMVGDDQQNIYSFNATINGFKATENIGTTFDLSKSYRVSQCIAEHMEVFCKTYLNKDMVFKGVEYTEEMLTPEDERTVAYIFRTNAGIVDQMLELEKNNKPYNVSRSIESLFRIHRTLIFCKAGGTVYDQDLQFIQQDCDEWTNDIRIQKEYPKFYSYLLKKNENNVQLKTAIQTILKYGAQTVLSIYKQAKAHEDHSGTHQITLTTSHASKGNEWDVVHIGEDMNKMLTDIKQNYKDVFESNKLHPSEILTNSELEEFRLYYVAGTRGKLKVYNAKHLSSNYVLEDKILKQQNHK